MAPMAISGFGFGDRAIYSNHGYGLGHYLPRGSQRVLGHAEGAEADLQPMEEENQLQVSGVYHSGSFGYRS